MQTDLTEQLGIEVPIFAFSYMPEVVAAVSRAGGLGVLGAVLVGADAEELDEVLDELDEATGDAPYGVDVVMPASTLSDDEAGQFDADELERDLREMIPDEHWEFVEQILDEHDVPPLPEDRERSRVLLGWTDTTARPQVDVALSHDIALLANALGPPPEDIVDEAHDHGVPVAALVGRADQAVTQQERGVDVIVAQGTEAGGHTGEVATMVLVPEVVEAVSPTPVLAAGGIGRGSQVAAALTLGAQGAWTGSIWVDAAEHDQPELMREKIHAATATDAVRSRALTGKPARQLRTAWIDAWEDPDTPDPLGMPLQYMLNAEANERIRAADAEELLGTPIGQIVGSMTETRTVADIMADLRSGLDDALGRLCDGD